MIAKCVALLAIVAQINGYVCNSNYGNAVVASGSSLGTSSAVVASGSGIGGSTGNTRNYVARGKYPVALDNTGPVPDGRIPVTTSHVQAPVQEKPTVRLSSAIPAPRTVSHSCTCFKSILRPRVHDQFITVPSVQRYIETTHTPVVENIQYEAVPINSVDNVAVNPQLVPASSSLQLSSGVSSLQVSPFVSDLQGYSSNFQVAQSVPVTSGFQVAQSVPVTSGIQVAQSVPVTSGIQVAQSVPVTSGIQVAQSVPVTSGIQVAQSVPVSSFSSGISTSGVQGCY